MAALAPALRAAGVRLLDLLLPPQCLTCDAPVSAPGQFCAACFRQTAFITRPFCIRCGVPFAYPAQGGTASLCPNCREHPPVFDRARGALRYDAQARRLVLGLKHGDRTEFAGALAALMGRAGRELLAEAELLIPVPLHRRRLLTRRFNQAALLGRALARAAGRPLLADALVRMRRTRPLEDRTAAERAAELADAVAVRPSRSAAIAGRRVLLIDDVLTSGATANECARALRAAGAAAVDVLAAARVPDPRLG